MTSYAILIKANVGDDMWQKIGEAEGGNDLAAIRAFLGTSDGEYGAGLYRAIPRRSWPDEAHDLKPQVRFV